MIILVTIIITIAVRGNGQVLTTHSDTWDHMILLWGRI